MKAIRTVLACIRKADNTYNMINHGDKIMIGLSGGKDSMALTYCLSLYQKFSHTDFTIQPVVLDLGFPGFNPAPLREFCESLGLTLIVSNNQEVYKILKIQQKDSPHLPCSICSRMKKAAINKVANELGFNKVAFAHHADDAIETFYMNMIYGARLATFSPKMHLEKADIEFIRPLALVREKDIIRLCKEENIPIVMSKCPADKFTTREDVKNRLHDLYKAYPTSETNFLTMLSNYQRFDVWDDKINLKINQKGLYLKPILTPMDMAHSMDIRQKVFCKEQGVAYEEEVILSEDKQATAFLICLNDDVIGTIRYRIIDNEYKIERFAILKEHRGKGYGKESFNFLADMIEADHNPCTITLNSQIQVKDLYLKCGFTPVGEEFEEAGIKHIKMIKKV